MDRGPGAHGSGSWGPRGAHSPALAAAAGMEAAKLGLYDIAASWRGAPGRTGAQGAPGPRALWCARARVCLDRGIWRIWRIWRADLADQEGGEDGRRARGRRTGSPGPRARGAARGGRGAGGRAGAQGAAANFEPHRGVALAGPGKGRPSPARRQGAAPPGSRAPRPAPATWQSFLSGGRAGRALAPTGEGLGSLRAARDGHAGAARGFGGRSGGCVGCGDGKLPGENGGERRPCVRAPGSLSCLSLQSAAAAPRGPEGVSSLGRFGVGPKPREFVPSSRLVPPPRLGAILQAHLLGGRTGKNLAKFRMAPTGQTPRGQPQPRSGLSPDATSPS